MLANVNNMFCVFYVILWDELKQDTKCSMFIVKFHLPGKWKADQKTVFLDARECMKCSTHIVYVCVWREEDI